MDNGGTKKNKTTSPKTREGKASVYEGGHRVPGIVWAPGRVTPGTSSELVVSMDIMPTSLTMANVDVPEGHRFDGLDVGPALFESKSLAERTVIWGRGVSFALRRGPWKLVQHSKRKKVNELYHLDEDPGEIRNLSVAHSERVQQLVGELNAIYEEALSESPYEFVTMPRS